MAVKYFRVVFNLFLVLINIFPIIISKNIFSSKNSVYDEKHNPESFNVELSLPQTIHKEHKSAKTKRLHHSYKIKEPVQFHVDDSLCNGFFLESKLVITAAHCFFNETKIETRSDVKLAIENYNGSLQGELYIHHEFQYDSKINDVAVYKLDHPVSSREVDTDLTLYYDNRHLKTTDDSCFLWRTKQSSVIPVNILPENDCKKLLNDRNRSSDGLTCGTEETESSQHIVEGNSGSALVCQSNNELTIQGILSYKLEDVNVFIFSNLSHFTEWIYKNFSENQVQVLSIVSGAVGIKKRRIFFVAASVMLQISKSCYHWLVFDPLDYRELENTNMMM